MQAANEPFGWGPGRRQRLRKALFASSIPLRIDSPTLEEIINDIWTHEIRIRNAGGVGRWAGVGWDVFSGSSTSWDSMSLWGWDLINHRQRHVKHTGICPTACSVIFLKASREVHPSGIQKVILLLSGKEARKRIWRERWRRERGSEWANVLKC